ncbi:hypothetical protein [Bacillus vallismortis]|uniref:hypothetical protein n=1 Tax=Bacillus vallismortis TaxID=72361 RepID=UPI002090EB1F|nr:hypothetical protein [Bacillus vallismortis]MCO4852441.1 hypothetical protein [Bacillus vallismortis]
MEGMTFNMTKKTFNIADLTRAVYGIDDINKSDIFDGKRKLVGNHIKEVQKMLGHSPGKFEAPMEELEAYVQLIKNMLENSENDDALFLLRKKMIDRKPLNNDLDGRALDKLVKIVAEAEKLKMTEKDKELFEKWLNDQLSDDYYTSSEKNLNEVMSIVKNDFSLFDDLSSLKSKLEFQEQYMNDIRTVSAMYRLQVEEQLLLKECFLEVVNSHPHLNAKTMYTIADYLELPPTIQQEIQDLIEQKRQKPSES